VVKFCEVQLVILCDEGYTNTRNCYFRVQCTEMLGGAMNGLSDPLGSNPAPLGASASGNQNNSGTTVKAEKRARIASPEDNGEYDEWAKRLVNRPIPQMVTGTPQVVSNNSVNNFLLQSVTNGNGSVPHGSTSVTVGSDGLPPHKG